MRRCPVCGVPLARVRYEGLPVHKCARCHGILVEHGRLEQIRRKMEKGIEDLGREVRDEAAPDTPGCIRCPKCHCPMEKERAFARDRARFSAGIDDCARRVACEDVGTVCELWNEELQ